MGSVFQSARSMPDKRYTFSHFAPGCGGIRTMVIRADAPIAARLLAAGHASDGTAMFKALEPAAKPAR